MYGDYDKIATSYTVKTPLLFISWLITQNERVTFSKVKVAPKLLTTILKRIKEMITKQNGLEFIIMWIYRWYAVYINSIPWFLYHVGPTEVFFSALSALVYACDDVLF